MNLLGACPELAQMCNTFIFFIEGFENYNTVTDVCPKTCSNCPGINFKTKNVCFSLFVVCVCENRRPVPHPTCLLFHLLFRFPRFLQQDSFHSHQLFMVKVLYILLFLHNFFLLSLWRSKWDCRRFFISHWTYWRLSRFNRSMWNIGIFNYRWWNWRI